MPDPIYEGIVRDRGGHVFNVQAFGATGSGDIGYHAAGGQYDSEYVAIMKAIKAANEAGGGIVYFPPTPQFYAIREAIQELRGHEHPDAATDPTKSLGDVHLDGVTLMGAGHASCIRHVGSGYVFRLGGYEGGAEWSPWHTDQVFHDAAPAARGSSTVTLSSTAILNAPNPAWQPGDIVFLRTVEADVMQVINPRTELQEGKDLPFASEVNEITAVDKDTGGITLKHPLSESFPQLRVARVTSRLDEGDEEANPPVPQRPITVLRRFGIQALRLEVGERGSPSTALAFGGLWECHFRDLWLSAASLIMLNVMARCTVENVVGTFWTRLGEVAYLSHHNVWRNIRASYWPSTGVPQGNGFGFVEGTRDNTVENLVLHMGSNANRPVIMGGKRNKLLRSTIVAPSTALPAIAIMDRGRRYKPQGCVIEDCDVYVGQAPNPRAYFAIEVDAGGPHGGGCIVRGNRVYGEPRLGMIGLARADKLDPLSGFDTSGCERNVVEGNVHVHGAAVTTSGQTTYARPVVSGVVEYNNRAPASGVQTLADAAFVPGDNLVRDNETPLRQRRVLETALGSFSSPSSGTWVNVRRYTIPRYSVGTHHRWTVEARGRVPAGTSQRHLGLFAIGAQPLGYSFASGESAGTWVLRATIGGEPTAAAFQHGDTAIGTKIVSAALELNGTVVAHNTVEYHLDSNQLEFWVELRVLTAPLQTLVVDEWRVTPSGDEWTYLNWELAKLHSGPGGAYDPPAYYYPDPVPPPA